LFQINEQQSSIVYYQPHDVYSQLKLFCYDAYPPKYRKDTTS